jgi:hypothetical protein
MKIPEVRSVKTHLLKLDIVKPNDKEWYDKAEKIAKESRERFVTIFELGKYKSVINKE